MNWKFMYCNESLFKPFKETFHVFGTACIGLFGKLKLLGVPNSM